MATAIKKVNISLDEELLAKIDKYADDNFMSRSGFVSLAANRYLAQVETLEYIKGMALAMRKIADNGFVDQETREQLEQFEKTAQYIGLNLK